MAANVNSIYTKFTSFPVIPANLKLEIYYLEAPLSILGETVGVRFTNNLVSINGFHTGIGFQCTDRNNPYEFTVDYIISEGFTLSALVPEIVASSSGTQLIWHNESEVTLGQFIDRTYWQRSTYITTISSNDLPAIGNWINNVWVRNNPIYSLFLGSKNVDVTDPDNLDSNLQGNIIMRSSICDTFCYALIGFLNGNDTIKQNGTQIVFGVNNYCVDYATVPNISINVFVERFPGSIVPVDFASNSADIIAFYEEFEDAVNRVLNFDLIIDQIIQMIEDEDSEDQDSLIRLVFQEIFTTVNLVSDIYRSFGVIYYYGYHPNGQLGYWRITQPNPVLAYSRSSLKRNFFAKDVNGQYVLDDDTVEPRECICLNIEHEENNFNMWFIIIIIIIIFLLLIFIIIINF